MTGIRKRVTTGFVSIVCLLFFSGMISLFELSHLSRDTDDILKASQRNMELAKEMMTAAHEQNVALIRLSVFGDRDGDSLARASLSRLEQAVITARSEAVEEKSLDSLGRAVAVLKALTVDYLRNGTGVSYRISADSLDTLKVVEYISPVWYRERFEQPYRQLVGAVQDFMTATQSSLAPRVELVKRNASRAVRPVLISLVVMIVSVLMLYYFMLIYAVNPILYINRALGTYLRFRMPFKVKDAGRDETAELCERIETLITRTPVDRSKPVDMENDKK